MLPAIKTIFYLDQRCEIRDIRTATAIISLAIYILI